MLNFTEKYSPLSTSKSKKTFILRKLLIGALMASFAYLIAIFIYQYLEQQKVKERLNAAYASSYQESSALFPVYSAYSEADNLFRLYTVNFDENTYLAYKLKLDTIKFYVDSISNLPLADDIMQVSTSDMGQKNLLAQEFVSLKQTVEQLIFFTSDSLALLSSTAKATVAAPRFERADSVMNRILRDTSLNSLQQDTTIRKKEKLFNRIFNAKNDTLVASTIIKDFNTSQRDVISRHIEYLINQNKIVYGQNIKKLQRSFKALQEKEKELIQANRNLLDNLRKGIDKIKTFEIERLRDAEEKDLAIYKLNTINFRNQLIASLAIILLMMIFIFYYQSNAISYERKLQEEKDYAAKIAAEKTTILASVSHEVRTPINSLLGIIDILRRSGSHEVIDEEYLDSASHEIEVINSTVNDILNISKLEAGVLDVEYDFFSPYEVMDDIIHLHRHHAQKKNIKVIKKLDIDSKLLIYSSEFRMRQIVSNLLSNAIKYTELGDVHIHAYIKVKNGKSFCFVEVKDSGRGIALEEQVLVFRPYYMAGSKVQSSSFGLGLYISKLFVEQLHGSLELDSVLGKGSTFTLSFPIKESKIEHTHAVQYTLADLSQDLQIAIVDDNRINILYLKHYFKDFANVHIFEKGQDTLEYMKHNPVQLVITDLHMAAMNGWELLEKIRNNGAWQYIKVFVFTADNMYFEIEQQNQKNQFDGKLKKPLDVHDLITCIRKVK